MISMPRELSPGANAGVNAPLKALLLGATHNGRVERLVSPALLCVQDSSTTDKRRIEIAKPRLQAKQG